MSEITRNDAVMAVMQVFDRLEAAERKADKAACELGNMALDGAGLGSAETSDEPLVPEARIIDATVEKAGRKAVLKECVYGWSHVTASRDEESGLVNVTSYEKWLKKKISRIPDYASRVGFLAYFADDLREMYEADKAEAIAELEEDE